MQSGRAVIDIDTLILAYYYYPRGCV